MMTKSPIPLQIKICGITKPDQGVVISKLGATALGFICVPSSPRYISPSAINSIVDQIPTNVEKIGVFANADIATIYTTVQTGKLTGVQLHGDESPEFCQQLASKFIDIKTDIKIIKALRIRSAADLQLTTQYQNYVDTFLLDAYHPQQLGGTGKILDWELLADFQPGRPWWLAGGINPDNVVAAIQTTHADGIDLSSGVEISPGNKDLEKVKQLFVRLQSIGGVGSRKHFGF